MAEPRVALVTGAARGIGAATVAHLVSQGYRVVAVDACHGGSEATREDLDAVVAAGRAAGLDVVGPSGDGSDGAGPAGPDAGTDPGRVVGVVADVRDADALTAAVQRALDTWGRLDAVVGAAAVLRGGKPLWETDPADLDLLWNVDAVGLVNLARAAIPTFLAQPDPTGCRFVALVSAAGTRGLFHLGAYSIAKHAALGVVRALAADLVGTGVSAIAVSPGSTRTDMLQQTAEVYRLNSGEDLAEHQLIHRLLEPAEIAEVIGLCCSVGGAALNGSVVEAGGGFRG